MSILFGFCLLTIMNYSCPSGIFSRWKVGLRHSKNFYKSKSRWLLVSFHPAALNGHCKTHTGAVYEKKPAFDFPPGSIWEFGLNDLMTSCNHQAGTTSHKREARFYSFFPPYCQFILRHVVSSLTRSSWNQRQTMDVTSVKVARNSLTFPSLAFNNCHTKNVEE